jgi:hypothetical protein
MQQEWRRFHWSARVLLVIIHFGGVQYVEVPVEHRGLGSRLADSRQQSSVSFVVSYPCDLNVMVRKTFPGEEVTTKGKYVLQWVYWSATQLALALLDCAMERPLLSSA